MKKYLTLLIASVLGLSAVSCSDWMTAEPIYKDPYNIKTEEEIKALLDYKRSEHRICFGWYSSWTGMGDKMQSYLIGLPDSMDVVSYWNPTESYVQPLTDAQKKDLKEVKEKGTKVLFCIFFKELGFRFTPGIDYSLPTKNYDGDEEAKAADRQKMIDTWGWYEDRYDGSEGAKAAIRKYAQVMTAYVLERGFDGIDFDYEAHWGLSNGNIGLHPDAIHVFLEELSKNFGPKSGTGRILAVDGEPQSMNAETGPLVDYYIIQAYSCSGDGDLDNRFAGSGVGGTPALLAKFGSVEDEATVLKKTIWTEDFEKYQTSGGAPFKFRTGHKNPGMELIDPNDTSKGYQAKTSTMSLDGMARYYREINGETVNAGGFGAFRFDIARGSDDYLVMRRAIQAANPSPETLKKLESQTPGTK